MQPAKTTPAALCHGPRRRAVASIQNNIRRLELAAKPSVVINDATVIYASAITTCDTRWIDRARLVKIGARRPESVAKSWLQQIDDELGPGGGSSEDESGTEGGSTDKSGGPAQEAAVPSSYLRR